MKNSFRICSFFIENYENSSRTNFRLDPDICHGLTHTVTHYVGLIGIDNTNKRVRLNISSTPQIKLLDLNEEWKVDVSNDGYYDILVKAVSMNSYKVNVSMKYINEKVPVSAVQNNQSVNNSLSIGITQNNSQNASLNSSIGFSDISKLDSTGLISVVVVLIIVVVIILLWIGYLRKYVFEKKVQRSVRYTDSKR